MEEVRLADVCLNMHQGINTVAEKIEYQATGIPIIQSKNITSGFLDLDDVKYVEEAKYDFYKNKYNPQKDDILVCNIGTIGKSLLIQNSDRFLIAWNLFLLKIDTCMLYPAYLKQYLDVLNKKNYFNKFLTGGTVKFINKKTMGEIKIPLPPLEEQKHIAAVLSKAEALIAERKQSIQLLDAYLKSTFLEMFGDPVKNEKGLKKIALGELGIWKTGGTPSRKNVEYFNGDIPWITSGELETLYISDTKEKITIEAINNSNTKLIESGSILLGMYDTAALKSSITIGALTCNQAIAYSKLDESKCNTLFIYFQIQLSKDYFKSEQRGVRQQNMNLSMIKGLKVLYPKITLQTQFAQIVEKTEALKAQYKEHLQELEQMYGALSQKAFREERKGEEVSNVI